MHAFLDKGGYGKPVFSIQVHIPLQRTGPQLIQDRQPTTRSARCIYHTQIHSSILLLRTSSPFKKFKATNHHLADVQQYLACVAVLMYSMMTLSSTVHRAFHPVSTRTLNLCKRTLVRRVDSQEARLIAYAFAAQTRRRFCVRN